VHRHSKERSLIERLLLSLFCVTDPTYMIRAVPSNASDNVYCTLLAQSAVHGAMAGYTGYTSGLVNGRQTYIPFYVSSFIIIFVGINI
jgi:6-phosphofructokinase